MNWDIVNALGEMAGAAAVVVSLIYLARQVALSNRLAQAEAWRTALSDLTGLNASFGTDPVWRRAMIRVQDGAVPADIDEEEGMAVFVYAVTALNIYEQLFRQVDEGVLHRKALTEFSGRVVLEWPYTRAAWPFMREGLSAPFVEYIENTFDLASQSSDVMDRVSAARASLGLSSGDAT